MYRRILILFLFATCLVAESPAQVMARVAQQYYRSDPYRMEFSQFLRHLINDPTLENRQLTLKTDSVLFFLEGTYRSHRPFFFPALQCRVILAEAQEMAAGSDSTYYQFYAYQLIGEAAPGPEGRKDVEEEYKRLTRQWGKNFDSTHQRDIRYRDQPTGQIHDYGFAGINLMPLTLAWASTEEGQKNLLVITLRFLVQNNRAFFPVPVKRSQGSSQ